MRASIEASGTHVKNGFVKVRIDLYPDPADKTYALCYVDHYDREPTEAELDDPAKLALVPTHKELNPCLCHFIEVPEDITQEQLHAYIEQLFTPDCLATLDDALVQENSSHLVSPYICGKPKMAAAKIAPETDRTTLVEAINSRLTGLALTWSESGTPQSIEPGSIDVGPGAISRSSTGNVNTIIDQANPANADGTLDTVELWFASNATGVEVATFYASAEWSTRDYETIGNVTSGSKQTFTGLSIDVLANDLIGVYFASGTIEKSTSGGTGFYYLSPAADLIPCNNGDFSNAPGAQISIYGTGTEGGGGPEEKTSAETGAGVESVSGRGLAGGETGSGAESLGPRSLAVPDAGSGVEGAVAAAVLLAGDTGLGTEYAHILGLWEVLFSGDDGLGSDALKALTARTGPDTRLRPGYGRVNLPHKEVNL